MSQLEKPQGLCRTPAAENGSCFDPALNQNSTITSQRLPPQRQLSSPSPPHTGTLTTVLLVTNSAPTKVTMAHLVLWNLGLVIRFPPSSSILFPRALVTHSRLHGKEKGTRCAVVQYFSGGLPLADSYGVLGSSSEIIGRTLMLETSSVERVAGMVAISVSEACS
ncbi:hypothetical protein BDP27DRAFT_1432457 [Rhodocollybia butyracea]|uniref:Uncharacterized protein n=1 Tax=Rhodocollybia butyracea TaxID=206335 RepID=A0A9P5P895_9AGAR|nr:hypothetical protein BDP27DRAFT_1432457 [Rhodocollybia butyracea]